MEFKELLNHILLLPAEQKQVIQRMLNAEHSDIIEPWYKSDVLRRTPEWKEMESRVLEVFKAEKSCLVHFDDHITSLNF